MKLNKIERAYDIYREIKKLDQDIVDIERIAELAANDSCEFCFNISAFNIKKKKEADEEALKKQELDKLDPMYEYKQLLNTKEPASVIGVIEFIGQNFRRVKETLEEKQKFTEYYEHNIGTTSTLRILSLLLYDKKDKRDDLLSQLKKLGIDGLQ